MKPTEPHDCEPAGSQVKERQRFFQDVLRGLRQPEKELPCKYFYDAAGAQLFEKICELDEYYLTRTELAIMHRSVGEMAALIGPRCLLVEYGSGSSLKTQLLLDRLPDAVAYVPIDMSPEFLLPSAAQVAARYPNLEVLPLCADFTSDYNLPEPRQPAARRVVYFPGSTIGNFGPAEAAVLLTRIARLCGPGGGMLLGFDLQKDVRILEAAYNDPKGVTRDFNLNLLVRINREIGADFHLDAFQHQASYNRQLNCVEMHLVSLRAQNVRIGGVTFHFEKDETIRTERSYKYDVDKFSAWAPQTGLRVQKVWTDDRQFFAVLFLNA